MKIWSIPHTYFQAKNLARQLRRLGVSAHIVDEINPQSRDVHIIIGAHACPVLPKRYIVYQTEIRRSHHFNGRYRRVLDGALAVWEYNEDNLEAYSHPNVSVVPPGVYPQDVGRKDLGVLFYGWIESSPRRVDMLRRIGRDIPVRRVVNVMGVSMWNLLSRSTVVINLHFYDDSPLELFRITEALSFGCHVVSEGPADERWSDVEFAEGVDGIVKAVQKVRSKPFDVGLCRYDNLECVRSALGKIG